MSGGALDRLRAVLGPDSVADTAGTPCVTPATADGLRRACQLANDMGWHIRVEGNGSWLPPDAPADIIISTRGLRQTVHASASDQVATVSAGVPFNDLRVHLAKEGMWLAIDPPGKPDRTIGSIVATATSGPLRTRYGHVKDHVLGCSVVTADGRLVEFGGQVMKNVAGFDITKLQVGGFGAFGVIVTVHLRLRALPRSDATVIARGTRDELTAAGRSILDQAIDVTALELLSPTVAGEHEWVLAARLMGSEVAARSEIPRLSEASDVAWDRLAADRGPVLWRMVADAAGAGPVSFRLGVLVDGLDQTIDTLIHHLDDGLIAAGAASGGLRWTGTATAEQLRTFRYTMAQQEIPLTLERAPWHIRELVGHFGAYREGVGPVIGRLRQTFDPANQLSVALEPSDV
ncbi:MAG: FAD-binding oxidoreductase [Gemmatimonadetes bacterium]|nr:FAD-binding oxidoreductase [Gemmatimonadota bacterium]